MPPPPRSADRRASPWRLLITNVMGAVLLAHGVSLLARGEARLWLTWVWLGLGLVLVVTGLRAQWRDDRRWQRGGRSTVLMAFGLVGATAVGAAMMILLDHYADRS